MRPGTWGGGPRGGGGVGGWAGEGEGVSGVMMGKGRRRRFLEG